MTDLAPLIRAAVSSARALNRLLVGELRVLRPLTVKGGKPAGENMTYEEVHAWHSHSDTVWRLQCGRDYCMQHARDLRRLASHLAPPA